MVVWLSAAHRNCTITHIFWQRFKEGGARQRHLAHLAHSVLYSRVLCTPSTTNCYSGSRAISLSLCFVPCFNCIGKSVFACWLERRTRCRKRLRVRIPGGAAGEFSSPGLTLRAVTFLNLALKRQRFIIHPGTTKRENLALNRPRDARNKV